MIRKTGNRAFAALNRILNLPGTQNLGEVDISVAQPVLSLERVVEASLLQDYLLYREADQTSATVAEYNLRPWDMSDWTLVQRNGSTIASPADIPSDYDVVVWEFGMSIDDGANLVKAFLRRLQNPGGTLFATGNRVMLWGGRSVLGTSAIQSVIDDDRPTFEIPLPWIFPARQRAASENVVLSVDSAATGFNWVATMRVFAAPPGVFPALP